MNASSDTIELAPEEWRDIPGLEGNYAASSHGRIRSYMRDPQGRLMTLTPGNSKRTRRRPSSLTFTPIRRNGDRSGLTVARAVCLAFHGEPPEEGMTARHVSNNPMDNRPQNVRWGW